MAVRISDTRMQSVMRLKRLLGILGLMFCFGCSSAPTAVAPEGEVQQRILTRADALEQPPAEPVPEVSVEPGFADENLDGVLSGTQGCEMLIEEGAVFEQEAAQQAYEMYAAGKYEAAAKQFEAVSGDATLSKADRQKVYFLLSLSLRRQAKTPEGYAAAAAWMSRAHQIDAPLQHAAAIYGTKIGYQAHAWDSVVSFTEQLLGSEEYRTYRGIALANLGRYEAAELEFEGIEKYPREIRLDALEARARAQSETAQLRSSLETYRKIYELDPNSAQGQLAQEAIMSQKDRWPAGFTFPRAAQKPDVSKSAREIALGHFNAHRSEQAIAAYTKLLKDDSKRKDTPKMCEDLYNIARSHVKLRAHSKSLPFFKEGLTVCAKSEYEIKFLYTGAKAAWNAGENGQALDWYQAIIDKYSDHSYADDAYHYQAQILTGQGKLDDARGKLNAQIRAYPDGDMAKDAYWMLLSDLYERGLYREAVAFVDENLAHAGESDLYSQGRLRYFQGRAYEKLSDTQRAIQDYLLVLSEYPLSYYAMLALGRLEVLDGSQASVWIDTYREGAFEASRGLGYCFHNIQHEDGFMAAQTLSKMGLYSDALVEVAPLLSASEPRVTYEAKLAKAILLQKKGDFSESARLAASLLEPVDDLLHRRYAAWLLAYPMPWRDIVEKGAPFGSDLYYTTYAIMREESYYNPKAESWANARGLMQLMLPTAQSTAAEIGMPKPAAADLFQPKTAIPIGSAYIAKLNRILAPHPMLVLPGYNAGQGNVGKWMTRFADVDMDLYVEKIPFKEARHYAKRVGTTLWRYRWLYYVSLPKNFDPGMRLGDLKGE